MLAFTVIESVRMVIAGRVQGVGFRHFIWHHAGALGLKGYVRNLPGGEVEVRAQGESSQIARLAALAREGPPSALVSEVRIEPAKAALPAGFRIR